MYNPDYFTIVHQVEKRVAGRNGVFGTTGPRFRPKVGEMNQNQNQNQDGGRGDRGRGGKLNGNGGDFVGGSGYGSGFGYSNSLEGGTTGCEEAEAEAEAEADAEADAEAEACVREWDGGEGEEEPALSRSRPRVKKMVYKSPFVKNRPIVHQSGFVVFGNGEVANTAKGRIRGVDDQIRGEQVEGGGSDEENCNKNNPEVAEHNKTNAGRPQGFNVSAPRGGKGYSIDGSKFKDTPGPQYHSKNNNIYTAPKVAVGGGTRRRTDGTFGKDARKFVDTGGGNGGGPGSYDLPGSFERKSFNITFKSKTNVYKRSRGGGDDDSAMSMGTSQMSEGSMGS